MKTIHSLLSLALVLAVAGASPAPAQYTAQPHRVSPVPVQPPVYHPPVAYCPPMGIHVSLWTDRMFYDVGDEMRLNVNVSQDAHVYIFNTDSRGVTRRIFPNPWDNDNYLRRGRTYRFPDRSRYAFLVEGPGGREELTVVAVSDHGGWIEQEYCRLDDRDPFPVVHGVDDFRVRYEASSRQGYEEWSAGLEYSSRGGPVAQPRSVRPVPVAPPPPVWRPAAYGEATKWITVREPIFCPPPIPVRPYCPPTYGDSYFYFEYNSGKGDWESGWRDRRDDGRRHGNYRHTPVNPRLQHPTPHGRNPGWDDRDDDRRGHDDDRGDRGRDDRRDRDDRGRVSLNSSPAGADVLVDRRHVGRTPLELDLPEGRYQVVMAAPGHDPWSRDIRLEPGATERVSVRLDR